MHRRNQVTGTPGLLFLPCLPPGQYSSQISSPMDRSITALLFLMLFVAVSRAASTPRDYWKTVLPSTPMPGAVLDLLHPDVLDEKATTVDVGHKGVGVNAPGNTLVGVGGGGVHVSTGQGKPGGTSVDVGHKGVGVNAPGNTHVGVGGGGVHVSTGQGKPGGTSVDVGHKGGAGVGVTVGGYKGNPPVIVTVPGYGKTNGFNYKYAATETQIHDNPDVALFFLEKDLHPGAKMNLHFTRTVSGAAFIPRSEANSIPFSSKKLPEILSLFSVRPHSLGAEALKQTLQECEEPAVAGERRYCATSLESMVDFTTSSLGTRDVWAVSTEVSNAGAPKQEYTVAASDSRRLATGKAVACHAQPYAYAVFYCHVTRATKAYVVPLVGKDGTKVEAVAVCHTDTSAWNPGHLAFQVLKVKPGTVPVCHFLPQDHIVWSPRY